MHIDTYKQKKQLVRKANAKNKFIKIGFFGQASKSQTMKTLTILVK